MPTPCAACGMPLCAPGEERSVAFERGLAGAVGVGSVAAVLWMLAAREFGSDVPPAIFAGGVLVALAARRVAGVRGTHIQIAAVLGFVAFLILGEFLIFKRALEPWLVALHEAEGATDAFARAQDELDEMKLGNYLHIATSLPTFLAVAGGIGAGLLLTRAPRAVTAFREPVPEPVEEPAEESVEESAADPTPDPTPDPTEEPLRDVAGEPADGVADLPADHAVSPRPPDPSPNPSPSPAVDQE